MKGVKTLNQRLVNKGVVSYKPLCAIKADGNPKQWYDNLYSCEMFHSAECTLMLSRYDE